MKKNFQPNGFTILELLIVLGVIGLLILFGSILLGTARERARDATRLSDLDITRRALEDYFHSNNRYPQAPTPILLGSTGYKVICAGTPTGFAETRSACGGSTVYLDPVPTPPLPEPAQLSGYSYTSINPNNTYTIDAALEGAVNGLQGKVQISPAGIQLKP
ncbi:MAG: type II secretion system protein [Candidatus Magasanikbacteria bacterium]|nr:type II secretion system protein [Candidatus Magasanikbacteria bacterium]